jgi:hypothetical protein
MGLAMVATKGLARTAILMANPEKCIVDERLGEVE